MNPNVFTDASCFLEAFKTSPGDQFRLAAHPRDKDAIFLPIFMACSTATSTAAGTYINAWLRLWFKWTTGRPGGFFAAITDA